MPDQREQKLIENLKTYADKLQTAINERERLPVDTDPKRLKKARLNLLGKLSNIATMQRQYNDFVTSLIVEGEPR